MNLDTLAARMQQLTYKILKSSEMCDQWLISPHGLTISQGYTLLAFAPQGAVSMGELSASMELANSTMTRMVDQLVRKGLVQREPDDADRRVILVSLTPQGQEMQHALRTEFQEFFELVLQEIEEDERATVVDALEKLVNVIEQVAATCQL